MPPYDPRMGPQPPYDQAPPHPYDQQPPQQPPPQPFDPSAPPQKDASGNVRVPSSREVPVSLTTGHTEPNDYRTMDPNDVAYDRLPISDKIALMRRSGTDREEVQISRDGFQPPNRGASQGLPRGMTGKVDMRSIKEQARQMMEEREAENNRRPN